MPTKRVSMRDVMRMYRESGLVGAQGVGNDRRYPHGFLAPPPERRPV